MADLQKRRRQSSRNILSAALAFTSATVVTAQYYSKHFHTRRIQHTSQLSGEQWVQELLQNHPQRIKNNMGVSQEGFHYICNFLQRKTMFGATKGISAEEQLAVFLYAVTTNLSMRRLAERFQHSTETIHRIYHRVMRYFIAPAVYKAAVRPATADTPIAESILQNRNFFPYFKDCIGAVDGTHIPVSPRASEKAAYRNRKGFMSQNVLAACDFDGMFTDVLCGWEGSVSDSTLWLEAMRKGHINIPAGRYMLGDAGFANCEACLTPYRNVRYHLQEWSRGNKAPQTSEELFNLRHSSLRNAIERIFGVMKARYKILTYPRPFAMQAQVRVIAALCVLHNILTYINGEEEDLQMQFESADEHNQDAEEDQARAYNISRTEYEAASAKRDAIARAMWDDYVARKQRHMIEQL